MAALSSFLLRRASCSVLHLQNRRLSARFLPFSTSSDNDLTTQIESVLEQIVPPPIDEPHLPIPDGFPFSIKNYYFGMDLLRQDKDEKTKLGIHFNTYQLTNGNPSFEVDISIVRGYWHMDLTMIVGYQTMSIQKVKMSERRYQHVRCFEEFLESKGIDARKIVSLFNLFMKKKNESATILQK